MKRGKGSETSSNIAKNGVSQAPDVMSPKSKHKFSRKEIIILCIVALLAIIVVVALIWVLIVNLTKQPEEVIIPYTPAEKEQALEQQKKYPTVYKEVTESTEDDDSKSAISDEFQQKIDSASNPAEANVARIAQMQYEMGEGDYDKVIEIGKDMGDKDGNACESPDTDLYSRMCCHGYLARAYYFLDQIELTDFHSQRNLALTDEYYILMQEKG